MQAFNVTITRHDLTSLANMNWLNDEVGYFSVHVSFNLYINLKFQSFGSI